MYLEKSWEFALNEEFQKPYFLDLIKFINSEYIVKEGAIFPSKSTVFQALNLCPIENVKVVQHHISLKRSTIFVKTVKSSCVFKSEKRSRPGLTQNLNSSSV